MFLVFKDINRAMPGVALMVRVVGLGSEGPEFKSHSDVELMPGGVDATCHPSEVGKMSTSQLAGMIEPPFEYPSLEWRPVQGGAQ